MNPRRPSSTFLPVFLLTLFFFPTLTSAVADKAAPIVTISSPASGLVYSISEIVTLTASASDDVGVTKVEFYDGTTLKSTDTTVPYTHAWGITSLDNGTHSWTAKAYDASGKYAISTAVRLTVNIDAAAPSIPTGLTATAAGCSQINLSWTGSSDTGGSGLAGYRVYRNGVWIATTSVTSYSSAGLAASTGYSFTVAAYDHAGNVSAPSTAAGATTPSCADTVAPSVPTGLTATAASCSQINLSWYGSSDTGGSGLAGYRVYRNGVWVATTSVASYSSTGLLASTSYFFRVAAYDRAGNLSAQSTATAAATPGCVDTVPPSIPTGLTAAAAGCNQINLSWTGSSDTGGSGLAGYRVYRSGVQIATTTVASYSSTGLTGSTAYLFTVAAYDHAGNVSAPSTAVSATTPACLANQPPIAYAGADQTTSVGTTVTFSGSGSRDPDGTISSYAWDFGDGTSGSGVTASHAYSTSGTKTVTLTVTDNSGARASDVAFVTVQAQSAASGQHLWSMRFGGSTLSDSAIVNAVATDSSGNVFVAGQFEGRVNVGSAALTSSGDKDIFIAKYSSSGAYQWSKRFGSTGSDIGYGIGVDSSSNVVVIGQFSGSVDFGGGALTSAGGTDIFLAKFSSSGAHVWSKRFGGTGNEVGYGIAVAGTGDMALTGYFGYFGDASTDFGGGRLTSAGGPDIFVAKFSASGVQAWSKAIGGTGQDTGLSVGMDSGGNVVVTGYFQNSVNFGGGSLTSAGGTDIFLTKFSASGAYAWSKRFGGASDDRGNGVAVAGTGEVVLTGYFNATADFGGGAVSSTGGTDIFLAKYSSTGTHTWSKVFGTSYGYGDLARGVALDISGNIALTGSILGPVDFGGGGLAETGSYDIFVAKFSASGAHLWSKRFGVLYDDHGDAVAMDAGGNVMAVGDFFQGVDFGGGQLLSPGNVDGFLVKFGP